MFRLFRKIRQQLLGTGSVKRYLLYALGEVILIVVGVMIAVELNNMNTYRVNRFHEQRILNRLDAELNNATKRISGFEQLLEKKLSELEAIVPYLQGEEIEDPKRFLESVIQAARFGFEQPVLQQTTFREILSSGQLSLILDIELRLQLTQFYHTVVQREERSTARSSDFPKIAYRLIPREEEISLKEGLSDAEIDQIVESVLNSQLRNFVIPEQNRAKFMLSIWNNMKKESSQISDRIQAQL